MVKNMKSIAILILAGLVAAAVNAAGYEPFAAPASVDATAHVVDIDRLVQDSAPRTIDVAPVLITAKAPARPARAVRQTAQCGAFAARDLVQGSGTVRGFCL